MASALMRRLPAATILVTCHDPLGGTSLHAFGCLLSVEH
jgi:hypothetical protein